MSGGVLFHCWLRRIILRGIGISEHGPTFRNAAEFLEQAHCRLSFSGPADSLAPPL
jgi:hypothetical protein